MDTFGKRLQKLLDEKLWTQTDLVEKCNLYVKEHPEIELDELNKGIVSQYLHDRCKPKSKRLHLLCKVLGVSSTYLLEGYEPQTILDVWKSPDMQIEAEQVKGEDEKIKSLADRASIYMQTVNEAQGRGTTLARLSALNKEHFSIIAEMVDIFWQEEHYNKMR